MQIANQVSSPISAGVGTALTSGTEGFDFLNCLLGLQVSDNLHADTDPLMSVVTDPEKLLTEEPEEKMSSKWEEMFSGGLAVGQAAPLNDPKTNVSLNSGMPDLPATQNQTVNDGQAIPKSEVRPRNEGELFSKIETKTPEVPEQPTQAKVTGEKPEPTAFPKNDSFLTANFGASVKVLKNESLPEQPLGELAKPRPDFQLNSLAVQNSESDRASQAKGAAIYRSAFGQPTNRPTTPMSGELLAANQIGPAMNAGKMTADESAQTPIQNPASATTAAEPMVQKRRSSTNEGGDFVSSDLMSAANVAQNQKIQASGIETPKTANQAVPVSEVFQKVETMALHGGGKMTVAIDPPDLGKVEIQVTTRGKKVEVTMTSESERTRGLLEGGLGHLKQSLESQDLTLTRSDLRTNHNAFSGQTAGDFRNFNGSGQSFARQPDQHRNAPGNLITSRNAVASVGQSVSSRTNASTGVGRVDLRI